MQLGNIHGLAIMGCKIIVFILAQKYAGVFVRGHYLFGEVNSETVKLFAPWNR